MTWIAVEKVHEPDAASTSADIRALTEQIRQLAFHLFESRGGVGGNGVDDWLNAERELFLTPESELVERDGKFEVFIPATGFDARDIHVTAFPASLVVRAELRHKHEGGNGNVRASEIGHKTLLRTIDLPEPIDIDKTTAKLEHGMIRVTAARLRRERETVVL